MPFSSASCADSCGWRRGSEELLLILDFFAPPRDESGEEVALRFPFTLVFLGGMLDRKEVVKVVVMFT